MANKLAGQRAKFTNARNEFLSANSDAVRERASMKMAQVLHEAPANGFTESQVTRGAEVPEPALLALSGLRQSGSAVAHVEETDGDETTGQEDVALLRQVVDVSGVVEIGEGPEAIYAYGYACAPDRLKVGMTAGNPSDRIAQQVGTSTPDKPRLLVLVRTHRAATLERALHSILDLRDRRVRGGGTEWFRITRDEMLDLVRDLERIIAPEAIQRSNAAVSAGALHDRSESERDY